MDGQVNDMNGNLFKPNKAQQVLVKGGWRRHSVKKQGMHKIIRWWDSVTGEIIGQGDHPPEAAQQSYRANESRG